MDPKDFSEQAGPKSDAMTRQIAPHQSQRRDRSQIWVRGRIEAPPALSISYELEDAIRSSAMQANSTMSSYKSLIVLVNAGLSGSIIGTLLLINMVIAYLTNAGILIGGLFSFTAVSSAFLVAIIILLNHVIFRKFSKDSTVIDSRQTIFTNLYWQIVDHDDWVKKLKGMIALYESGRLSKRAVEHEIAQLRTFRERLEEDVYYAEHLYSEYGPFGSCEGKIDDAEHLLSEYQDFNYEPGEADLDRELKLGIRAQNIPRLKG